jgi:hypothetical protein
MGLRFKSARTRIEVWTALPRATNWGCELLLPPPPYPSLISQRSWRGCARAAIGRLRRPYLSQGLLNLKQAR